MHQLMGYTWDEWVAMLTILTIIIGVLLRLLNQAIKNGTEQLSRSVDHLIEQIDDLSKSLKTIQMAADKTQSRVEELESRFEVHIGEAKVRNQKIKALEKEVFKHDKN